MHTYSKSLIKTFVFGNVEVSTCRQVVVMHAAFSGLASRKARGDCRTDAVGLGWPECKPVETSAGRLGSRKLPAKAGSSSHNCV